MMSAPNSSLTSLKSSFLKDGLTFLAFLYFSLCLLLPVERGMPALKIGGAPLYLPMLLNIVFVLGISASSVGWVINKLQTQWIWLNFAFMCWGATMSILVTSGKDSATAASYGGASSLEIAFYYFFLWGSNFILGFLVIFYFFEKIGIKRLAWIISIIVVIQVGIGIDEALGNSKFYIYEMANLNYLTNMGAIVFGPRGDVWDFRIGGTLGDPILFGVSLLLSIPLLVRTGSWVQYIIIPLAVITAGLTLSRTVFIFMFVYFGWLIYNLATFSKRKLIILSVILIVFFIVLANSENMITTRWAMRVAEEQSAQEVGGLELRLAMGNRILDTLLNPPLINMIVGNGFLSTREIAQQYQEISTTIDNSFLTVLYENGLLGFILYLIICAFPMLKSKERLNSIFYWAYIGVMLSGFSFVMFRVMSINTLIILIIIFMLSETPRSEGEIII